MNNRCVIAAAWLECFQESKGRRVGVGMNRYLRLSRRCIPSTNAVWTATVRKCVRDALGRVSMPTEQMVDAI